MLIKKFWRIDPGRLEGLENLDGEGTLDKPEGLLMKVSPRHGLVVAAWDADTQLGRVSALGVVRAVSRDRQLLEVTWRSSDVVLRPNPAGRRYWAQAEPFFGFASAVVERYMLADLFAERFPELDQIEFGGSAPAYTGDRVFSGAKVGGFVYVIRSQYGFKIGKTVNLKDRVRLFGVKLPFPISIEHYAWFDDYTHAERRFHDMFHAKRLEGEWFDLDDADLAHIKSFGERLEVPGL